jgi:hypothetical protein
MTTQRVSPLFLCIAVALAPACSRPVRTDDMSASAHRAEAGKERAVASAHEQEFEPGAVARPIRGTGVEPPGAAEVIPDYNPTTWHLYKADAARMHAAEHEHAAAELDRFEAAECAPFGKGVRAACPFLGPVRSAEPIENGVRLRLADGASAKTVVEHMRCHLAFARTRGFQVAECPLTLKGTEVTLAPDGSGVDVTTADHGTVRELRRRATALVEPVR